MKITQSMYVEIQVCGMVTEPDGGSTLADSYTPAKDPEFWDIIVRVEEWESSNSNILLEIDDIKTEENLEKILEQLAVFFLHASHETI